MKPEHSDFADPSVFERHQNYLRLHAQVQIAARYQAKIDPSDIVQQTLVKAYRHRDKLDGRTEPEVRAYLLEVLRTILINEIRHFRRAMRDVGREQPLAVGEASSVCLDRWLQARCPSPSHVASVEELSGRVVAALRVLDPEERAVVVLKYWHEMTLEAIGIVLERNATFAARRLASALRRLRGVAGLDALGAG